MTYILHREVRPVYNASASVVIKVGITLTQIFDMVSTNCGDTGECSQISRNGPELKQTDGAGDVTPDSYMVKKTKKNIAFL